MLGSSPYPRAVAPPQSSALRLLARHSEPLCELDLCRPQLPNDLFCGVSLPCHLSAPPLDLQRNPKIHAGSISGGEGQFRMPPLRRATVDEEALEVMTQWINALQNCD
jgi:hypothetical protein